MNTIIELIETFDPQPEAMVRSFHCAVCDKQHLQTGTLARVWVLFQEGYATQASLACLNAAEQSVQRTGGESGQQSLFSAGEVLPAKVTRQPTRR